MGCIAIVNMNVTLRHVKLSVAFLIVMICPVVLSVIMLSDILLSLMMLSFIMLSCHIECH